MSRFSALRVAVRASQPYRRSSTTASAQPLNSSSNSHQPQNAPSTLPDEKMRALVELYQTTPEFVTLETLDETIDRVFATQYASPLLNAREISYKELHAYTRRRKMLPKIGSGAKSASERDFAEDTGMWSETKSMREKRVWKALNGMEGGRLPGFDMLKDEEERIQEHLKRDRQS